MGKHPRKRPTRYAPKTSGEFSKSGSNEQQGVGGCKNSSTSTSTSTKTSHRNTSTSSTAYTRSSQPTTPDECQDGQSNKAHTAKSSKKQQNRKSSKSSVFTRMFDNKGDNDKPSTPFFVCEGDEAVFRFWMSLRREQQIELLDIDVDEVVTFLKQCSKEWKIAAGLDQSIEWDRYEPYLKSSVHALLEDSEKMTDLRSQFVQAMTTFTGEISRLNSNNLIEVAVTGIFESRLLRRHSYNKCVQYITWLIIIFTWSESKSILLSIVLTFLFLVLLTFERWHLADIREVLICSLFDDGDSGYLSLQRFVDFAMAATVVRVVYNKQYSWYPELLSCLPVVAGVYQHFHIGSSDDASVNTMRIFFSYILKVNFIVVVLMSCNSRILAFSLISAFFSKWVLLAVCFATSAIAFTRALAEPVIMKLQTIRPIVLSSYAVLIASIIRLIIVRKAFYTWVTSLICLIVVVPLQTWQNVIQLALTWSIILVALGNCLWKRISHTS